MKIILAINFSFVEYLLEICSLVLYNVKLCYLMNSLTLYNVKRFITACQEIYKENAQMLTKGVETPPSQEPLGSVAQHNCDKNIISL